MRRANVPSEGHDKRLSPYLAGLYVIRSALASGGTGADLGGLWIHFYPFG